MSRIRWFLAGAAVTAGALAAAPGAYQRLRSVVGPVTSPLLPGGFDEDDFEDLSGEAAFDVAADEQGPFTPAPTITEPISDDTMELRMRIDETRARIHERAQSVQPDGDDDAEETTSEL